MTTISSDLEALVDESSNVRCNNTIIKLLHSISANKLNLVLFKGWLYIEGEWKNALKVRGPARSLFNIIG